MRLEIQKLQAQCQMGQQALQDQDQRAAKAEALHARLKGQMEDILKVRQKYLTNLTVSRTLTMPRMPTQFSSKSSIK